jgi:hypothetical protein
MTTLADALVQLDALREQLRDIADRLELLRSYL